MVDSPHAIASTHPKIPKTIGILSDHFFITAPAFPHLSGEKASWHIRQRSRDDYSKGYRGSTSKPNQIGFELECLAEDQPVARVPHLEAVIPLPLNDLESFGVTKRMY